MSPIFPNAGPSNSLLNNNGQNDTPQAKSKALSIILQNFSDESHLMNTWLFFITNLGTCSTAVGVAEGRVGLSDLALDRRPHLLERADSVASQGGEQVVVVLVALAAFLRY